MIGVVAHRESDLRRKNHVVAPLSGERLGDDTFRFTVRIDIGSVDEVDAGVEGSFDDADAVVVVGVGPLAEHHRSEA